MYIACTVNEIEMYSSSGPLVYLLYLYKNDQNNPVDRNSGEIVEPSQLCPDESELILFWGHKFTLLVVVVWMFPAVYKAKCVKERGNEMMLVTKSALLESSFCRSLAPASGLKA